MSNSPVPRQGARRRTEFLCIVFLLLTCCVLSAQDQTHGVRNIVLVRGAWADGSGWKGVYDISVSSVGLRSA